MKILLLLYCLFTHALANPIDVYFKSSSIHSVHQRAILASGLLLGQPYQFDPLDDNHLSHQLKNNQFDCLTYIQTVMALIHASNQSMLHKTTLEARYLNSPHHYANRIHFASIELNPIYEKLHWIKPLNPKKHPLTYTTTKINFKQFWKHKLKTLSKKTTNPWQHALKSRPSIQPSTLAYFPINEILIKGELNKKLFKHFEPIMMVEFIHENWHPKNVATPLQVSHLGFMIHKKNQWILRHASSRHKKVLDEDLSTYLATKSAKTFKGIALWNIR